MQRNKNNNENMNNRNIYDKNIEQAFFSLLRVKNLNHKANEELII